MSRHSATSLARLSGSGRARKLCHAALALFTAGIGAPALASSSDLYVSPTGSDANIGIQSAPLRTIRAASQLAKPGTTVHVAPGTYQGGFVTAASGTNSARITYVSDVPWGAAIVGGSESNDNDAGWWNRGDYVDIRGFEIDGGNARAPVWRMGLYGSGSHDTFQGNKVHDVLTDTETYAAAAASGNGGAGVEMDRYYGGMDGLVTGNLVFNVGPPNITGNLAHGIYQTQSGIVANNVIYNVIGVGIHLWHGAQNIVIANNTVDGARSGCIVVGSGDSGSSATSGDRVTVINNIVTNCHGGIEEFGITGSHNTFTNNLVYRTTGWSVRLQCGQEFGTIKLDPKFVNPEVHDYHLQAGSPAIGAAIVEYAPTSDFDGRSRTLLTPGDLGAYSAPAP